MIDLCLKKKNPPYTSFNDELPSLTSKVSSAKKNMPNNF